MNAVMSVKECKQTLVAASVRGDGDCVDGALLSILSKISS
jgi:hypothetical protein